MLEKMINWLNLNNQWERQSVSAGYQLPEVEILFQRIDKDKFEIQILNHFLMRRIGSDTVTAFQIKLEDKLNSILRLKLQ